MDIKYDNLTTYLKDSNVDEITINYEELKQIIGGLTNSLLKYGRTFFNNNSLRNNYFKYWYNAGYLAFPDVKNHKVTFKKGVEPEHTERNKTLSNYKNIRKPCQEEVDKYLRNWETLNSSKYKYQEDSLELLYKTFPLNNKLEEILFKASTLNDFYSTNIFSITEVCQHIKELDIDNYLKNGDIAIVNQIANVIISEKNRNFYSFATKYCAHHKPEIYPIYDDYVANVLVYFNKLDEFYVFTKKDLKNYEKFYSVIIEFRKYYNLTNYSIRDIDKYLWQLGKEYFPKKYKKQTMALV